MVFLNGSLQRSLFIFNFQNAFVQQPAPPVDLLLQGSILSYLRIYQQRRSSLIFPLVSVSSLSIYTSLLAIKHGKSVGSPHRLCWGAMPMTHE